MDVARQHILMHLVGHPLTDGIDIRFHCERSALVDFGLVGYGKELSDMKAVESDRRHEATK